MPFFNAGGALLPAVHSILNQTYDNWELLLCDDGSNDGTLALARSIHDSRITVWSDGRRKGLAQRLNECIDRAQGEFMARMDADDISYPARFEKQIAYLKANPESDLIGCSLLIFGEDGQPLGKRCLPAGHEDIVARPELGFGLAHPTWMARAGWFRTHRYDADAVRYEDVELLYRAYRSSRFANLPQVLYGYREMHGGFLKRLKTRIGRTRYLAKKSGGWTSSRAALAESVRVILDAAVVAASARYAMLRWREQRLTKLESAEWRGLWDGVCSADECQALASVSSTGEWNA